MRAYTPNFTPASSGAKHVFALHANHRLLCHNPPCHPPRAHSIPPQCAARSRDTTSMCRWLGGCSGALPGGAQTHHSDTAAMHCRMRHSARARQRVAARAVPGGLLSPEHPRSRQKGAWERLTVWRAHAPCPKQLPSALHHTIWTLCSPMVARLHLQTLRGGPRTRPRSTSRYAKLTLSKLQQVHRVLPAWQKPGFATMPTPKAWIEGHVLQSSWKL